MAATSAMSTTTSASASASASAYVWAEATCTCAWGGENAGGGGGDGAGAGAGSLSSTLRSLYRPFGDALVFPSTATSTAATSSRILVHWSVVVEPHAVDIFILPAPTSSLAAATATSTTSTTTILARQRLHSASSTPIAHVDLLDHDNGAALYLFLYHRTGRVHRYLFHRATLRFALDADVLVPLPADDLCAKAVAVAPNSVIMLTAQPTTFYWIADLARASHDAPPQAMRGGRIAGANGTAMSLLGHLSLTRVIDAVCRPFAARNAHEPFAFDLLRIAPDLVVCAANDGVLHAFRVDSSTPPRSHSCQLSALASFEFADAQEGAIHSAALYPVHPQPVGAHHFLVLLQQGCDVILRLLEVRVSSASIVQLCAVHTPISGYTPRSLVCIDQRVFGLWRSTSSYAPLSTDPHAIGAVQPRAALASQDFVVLKVLDLCSLGSRAVGAGAGAFADASASASAGASVGASVGAGATVGVTRAAGVHVKPLSEWSDVLLDRETRALQEFMCVGGDSTRSNSPAVTYFSLATLTGSGAAAATASDIVSTPLIVTSAGVSMMRSVDDAEALLYAMLTRTGLPALSAAPAATTVASASSMMPLLRDRLVRAASDTGVTPAALLDDLGALLRLLAQLSDALAPAPVFALFRELHQAIRESPSAVALIPWAELHANVVQPGLAHAVAQAQIATSSSSSPLSTPLLASLHTSMVQLFTHRRTLRTVLDVLVALVAADVGVDDATASTDVAHLATPIDPAHAAPLAMVQAATQHSLSSLITVRLAFVEHLLVSLAFWSSAYSGSGDDFQAHVAEVLLPKLARTLSAYLTLTWLDRPVSSTSSSTPSPTSSSILSTALLRNHWQPGPASRPPATAYPTSLASSAAASTAASTAASASASSSALPDPLRAARVCLTVFASAQLAHRMIALDALANAGVGSSGRATELSAWITFASRSTVFRTAAAHLVDLNAAVSSLDAIDGASIVAAAHHALVSAARLVVRAFFHGVARSGDVFSVAQFERDVVALCATAQQHVRAQASKRVQLSTVVQLLDVSIALVLDTSIVRVDPDRAQSVVRTLRVSRFHLLLATGSMDAAFGMLSVLPDSDNVATEELVDALSTQRMLRKLCVYAWHDVARVESLLWRKACTQPLSLSAAAAAAATAASSTNLYLVLLSFALHHERFAEAALYAYRYALRIESEADLTQPAALDAQANALQSTINALHAASAHEILLTAETASSRRGGASPQPLDATLRIVALSHVYAHFQWCLARADVVRHARTASSAAVVALGAFTVDSSADPTTLVTRLCAASQHDRALSLLLAMTPDRSAARESCLLAVVRSVASFYVSLLSSAASSLGFASQPELVVELDDACMVAHLDATYHASALLNASSSLSSSNGVYASCTSTPAACALFLRWLLHRFSDGFTAYSLHVAVIETLLRAKVELPSWLLRYDGVVALASSPLSANVGDDGDYDGNDARMSGGASSRDRACRPPAALLPILRVLIKYHHLHLAVDVASAYLRDRLAASQDDDDDNDDGDEDEYASWSSQRKKVSVVVTRSDAPVWSGILDLLARLELVAPPEHDDDNVDDLDAADDVPLQLARRALSNEYVRQMYRDYHRLVQRAVTSIAPTQF